MQNEAMQTIREIENLLRDFAAGTLEKSLGADWLKMCGMTTERISKWEQRREEERQRQTGGSVEPRLIYYADFYDVGTILKKNWGMFAPALGEWKAMEVYLGALGKMRDAAAHGRELLPHQEHLAKGLAGDIRTRLIRYRSKLETSEDCFPRIESARDSLGCVWTPETGDGQNIFTKLILRPNDAIDLQVVASDPFGATLKYRVCVNYQWTSEWQAENIFRVTILEHHIGKNFTVRMEIVSPRSHHAFCDCDDSVAFRYTVLPAKT